MSSLNYQLLSHVHAAFATLCYALFGWEPLLTPRDSETPYKWTTKAIKDHGTATTTKRARKVTNNEGTFGRIDLKAIIL